MTAQTLPLSNVINVTITTTPQGLTAKNVNSLALFTTELPSNSDIYNIYVSASSVASAFGSGSITAAMANAIFAQTPNILSGGGRLVVIPLQHSVSATTGNIVTADISLNITNIIGVTNGNIKVTLNGTDHNLANLDFTRATNMTSIAAVLQAALPDAIVTNNSTTITITSKKVGAVSSVALAVYAGGGTDLAGSGYLKASSATAVGGANASGETIATAIGRTEAAVDYVGVITNLNMEDAVIATTAAAIQGRDMMYLQNVSSSEDILGIGKTIKDASETRTRILIYTPSIASANLEKAAYAGRGFSTDFTGSNTSSTMNLKKLATIDPDTGLTETIYTGCQTEGLDMYASTAGFAGILSTGGNDYFDNPYSDLALKFALEVAGFNFLAQTNTKVPQTETGMNGLKSAYSQVLEQFVTNGSVAPGSWTSSETFGDPVIFKQNILTRGYYIYSQPIVQQSSVQRDAREAPLVQIAVKRAGAIQSSDVLVIINA